MDQTAIQKALEEVGLAPKEAKVYLAALALGPATAQVIAAKAKVVRPTAYLMIESLQRRGLMSAVQKGKRRNFVAGHPNQLAYILAQQKASLEEKEKATLEVIEGIGESNQFEEPVEVKVLDHDEGIKQLQDAAMAAKSVIRDAVNCSLAGKHVPPAQKIEGDRREDIIKSKVLHSLAQYEAGLRFNRLPTDRITKQGRNLAAETIVIGDTTFFLVYGKRVQVIRIDNKDVATSVGNMFDAMYDESKK